MRLKPDSGRTFIHKQAHFMQKEEHVNEEVKDLLQTALDALDEILGMDEDKVSGDLWDEVNDAYHKVENIIE